MKLNYACWLYIIVRTVSEFGFFKKKRVPDVI
jgi:hypothetical protein